MKARIKKTGEIVNISEYATIALDMCDSYGNPVCLTPEDVELIQEQTVEQLSIEEKARRYDEAILQLKGLLDGIHEEKCDIMEEDIIRIFPELRESQDEKMMNQLHSWMKEFGGAEEYTEKVYNWLKGLVERQVESNGRVK